MAHPPRFSKATLDFIQKASRQKRADWLDRNREDYEHVLLEPLKHLASRMKAEVAPVAPGYHFPQKGIGRIRRSANRIQETGGSAFREWVSYSASRPTGSRFDHNPNLYFTIHPDDQDDPVLVAGGLYHPSSRQTRAIRETIADDASAFDRLFASAAFARRFPGGFSSDRISSRVPRGFDPSHPRMDWLRLQAFFVWRPYTKREFYSADFPALLAGDWKQIVRLNDLLERAIQGRMPKVVKTPRAIPLSEHIETLEAPRRPMDF